MLLGGRGPSTGNGAATRLISGTPAAGPQPRRERTSAKPYRRSLRNRRGPSGAVRAPATWPDLREQQSTGRIACRRSSAAPRPDRRQPRARRRSPDRRVAGGTGDTESAFALRRAVLRPPAHPLEAERRTRSERRAAPARRRAPPQSRHWSPAGARSRPGPRAVSIGGDHHAPTAKLIGHHPARHSEPRSATAGRPAPPQVRRRTGEVKHRERQRDGTTPSPISEASSAPYTA